MPPVNIAESSDKVVEINHHLVHLDSHRSQRPHLSDWSNPREFFSTLLHTHSGASSNSGHQKDGANRDGDLYSTYTDKQPPTFLNAPNDNADFYYVSTPSGSGSYHHEQNDTHFGITTNDLGHPGYGSSSPFLDDPEEESLIVVYALFVPLLITLIFILVIALYVRRMRRSTSMLDIDRPKDERYDLQLTHMSSKPALQNPATQSKPPVTKSTSFTTTKDSSSGGFPPIAPPRRSKKKSSSAKYLHRSISALGISSERKSGGQSVSEMYPPFPYYCGQEPGKRWNTSGFLNSTGSLNEICSDESLSASDHEDKESLSVKDDSESGDTDPGPVFTAEETVRRVKDHKRRHHHHHRRNHHHHTSSSGKAVKDPYIPTLEDGAGPIPVVIEDNYYRIEAMLQTMNEKETLEAKRSSSSSVSQSSKKSLKQFGGRIIDIVNIPKRIKQNSMEKKRFNIYTIPLETREQLKQIYVY